MFTVGTIGFGALFLALADGRVGWTTFFQVMSASTTVGFNTADISAYGGAATILLILLMAMGASPAGTGGGIKSTSVFALGGIVASNLRGRRTWDGWVR